MTKVILSQRNSSFPSIIAAPKHAKPAAMNVLQKSHFLPVFVIMYIANAIAGISTSPAKV